MNKYKEYLEEAKKRYWNETTEEMLFYLKEEREHLKLLKNALIKEQGLKIKDEREKDVLIHLYADDDHWEKVLNLLIESCQKDICMIKAIIYEQLENGKLFEEEE
jgi:hypothetical protein